MNKEKENKINNEFLKAVLESYKKYADKGARSNEKLKPIHGKLAEMIYDKTDEECIVTGLGYCEGKEKIVDTKYETITVDVCIDDPETKKPLGAIMVKAPCSSYKKNSKNYFRNMLGETVELKSAGIICSQITILPSYLPVYKDGVIQKLDYISDSDIEKYINLYNEEEKSPYRPDEYCLVIVDTGNEDYLLNNIGDDLDEAKYIKSLNLTYADIDEIETIDKQETKDFLKEHGSVARFIKNTATKVEAKRID